MKKLKRTRTTAAGIIASAMVASSFLAGCNEQPNVYGPPPETNYSSEQNIPETVYGPPEDIGLEQPVYPVDENELEDVYGPPVEDFEIDSNELEGVYGPPQG